MLLRMLPLMLAVFAALADTVAAQSRIVGRVAEVVDGRTFVIETGSSRIIASLRSIRTPLPGHPLYEAVREHFARLALGKSCEFQPIAIATSSGSAAAPAEGRLFVDGINIAEQLLRDGAAVFDPNDVSAGELREFEKLQSLAREEKRGIWAYPDTAEKLRDSAKYSTESSGKSLAAYVTLLSQAAGGALSQSNSNRKTAASRSNEATAVSLWRIKNSSADDFAAYYDPGIRRGFTATGPAPVELYQARSINAVYLRTLFLYSGSPAEFEESAYALAFLISADDFRFSDSSSLEITADGQKIPIGVPLRLARESDEGAEEVLFFPVSRQTIVRLATARRLGLKLSRYNGSIPPSASNAIAHLLEITR
ncbi:MAG: hypothetical protein C4324_01660 [Blastocatellia bacterium]